MGDVNIDGWIARARRLSERGEHLAAGDPALWAAAALPEGPQRDAMRLLASDAMAASGQLALAISRLDALLAEHPRHGGALIRRAQAHLRLGHRDAAVADLGALGARPVDPDDLTGWGRLLIVAEAVGDAGLADAAWDCLRERQALDGVLLVARGRGLAARGRAAEAVACWREACRLPASKASPEAAQALVAAGEPLGTGEALALYAASLEQAAPHEAIDALERAVSLGFTDPDAQVAAVARLARLLDASGHPSDAIAALQQLTEALPDVAGAWLARAAFEPDAALERAAVLAPDAAHLPRARRLRARGALPEALEACEAHLARDSMDKDGWFLKGQLHAARGDIDAAKTAWREATALGHAQALTHRVRGYGPEDGLDWFDLGLDRLDAGDRDGAAEAFDEAVRHLRGDSRAAGDKAARHLPRALFNAASLREQRVPDAELEPSLREAVALDPLYTDARCALGALCLRTDRLDEGRGQLLEVARMAPRLGQPWLCLARHHADRGEHDETLATATRALEAFKAAGAYRDAGEAATLRGRAHLGAGATRAALADLDDACAWGHPTACAERDDVRLVLALAEPDSDEALAWVERLISDMEYGDYPHHFNALLVARTAGDSRARQLVETWREAYELPPEDLRWLIGFVSAG